MRAFSISALVLPFAVSCMSGGPGGGTSGTGGSSTGGVTGEGSSNPAEGAETEEPESDETTTNGPDGIAFTIEGKTYTFAAQQKALPLASYLFLRTSESDGSEYPWVGLRAYTNAKGSYPCVNGGTVVWYARSKTESYTSTSCVINIRKLGTYGEIVEGDFSGTLQRDYQPPEDPEEPTTEPAPTAIDITRATFHMTARRSE